VPQGQAEPAPPEIYGTVTWKEPPPAVDDLEAVLRARLTAAPKSPAAVVARTLGWYFSGWEPDPTI
jgi:hypothetical protein